MVRKRKKIIEDKGLLFAQWVSKISTASQLKDPKWLLIQMRRFEQSVKTNRSR